MLTPSQLIPFLQHPDREVREEAISYFAEASDPAPATAGDLWESIERFGSEESEGALLALPKLPDTETSTRRLLAALRAAPSDQTWLRLIKVIDGLDLPMLMQFWDELDDLREQLPPRTLSHLAERRRLHAEPATPAALWQQLLDHAAEIDGRSFSGFDRLVSRRLIEALARHPDESARRALAVLKDDAIDDWVEIFAIELLGAMRWQPAIDPLIARLRSGDEEEDVLFESCAAALERIGDPALAEKIAATYAGESDHFRLYTSSVFGHIKHPVCETALVQLIPGESEPWLRTCLASALCALCPDRPEALALLHRLAVEGDYDASFDDLEARLLTLGEFVGWELPEAAVWRKRVAVRRERTHKAIRELEDPAQSREMRRRLLAGEDPFIDETDDDASFNDDLFSDNDPPPDEPQRRSAPKIGRNDLCPCGSGKKYKKCCLQSA